MDSWLNQNQTEFTILILAITLQMLADSNSLLDHMVQILRDVGFQANGFHDTQNFVTIDEAYLRNTMRITKNDTCSINGKLE